MCAVMCGAGMPVALNTNLKVAEKEKECTFQGFVLRLVEGNQEDPALVSIPQVAVAVVILVSKTLSLAAIPKEVRDALQLKKRAQTATQDGDTVHLPQGSWKVV